MSRPCQISYRLKASVACAGLVAIAWATSAQAQNEAAAGADVSDIVVSGMRQHYRGDVPLKELPQAVQIITGETLKEIGVTRLPDALDIAAGVARQNTFGGVWDAFAIRGFAGDLNVPSGYLVNGFNGGRGFGGLRDTSSIERIEILKGPGSALFGRGEPGGTVSITTKKPQFETEGSFTLAGGSYNFFRGEGDFTTPLSDAVAIRINGAVEDSDSFRDTLHQTRYFFSPSILAKIGEKTTISYELEWSRQEIPFDRGVVAPGGDFGIIPITRFLGEPGDGDNIAKVLGHQLQLEHDLGNDWTLLVGGAYRETKLVGFGQHPELAASRQPFYQGSDLLSRQRRFALYDSGDLVFRAEVSGNAEIAGMTHHILIGADYEEFELLRYQTRFRPPVFTGTQTIEEMNAINVFNPVYGLIVDATGEFIFDDTERQQAYGVYMTDQIDLTDKFKVRIGARYDKFKQEIDDRRRTPDNQPPPQDVDAFSPQFGIVYEPSRDLTFYAAYAKGFRPNSGFDFERNPFEPEETSAYEVGMKFSALDRKVNGTVALFTMKKTNVLTADPLHSGFSAAIGEAKSKGVEFELSGELPGQIRFQLAYAYVDAESASAPNRGEPLLNIPAHNASALLFKDFDIGERKLTLGANVKYNSKRLGQSGANFYLPAYTLVKAMASFEVTENFSIAGEVTNLFDKEYYPTAFWDLWLMPGAPRQFQVRASYKF